MKRWYFLVIYILVVVILFVMTRSPESFGSIFTKSESSEGAQNHEMGSVPGDGEQTTGRLRMADRERKEKRIKTTDSGLQYEVLEEGEGEHPGPEDRVEVHYEGTLEDGTVFDSSYERGAPIVLGLNQVIKGWTEGVQLMKPGAKYRFTIPADLAYGKRGIGKIPASSDLNFVIELISIK